MKLKIISALAIYVSNITAMANGHAFITPTYKVFKRQQIESVVPFVAAERLREFCLYPYLYKGSLEEELEYLTKYAQTNESVIIVAYHNDKPIGFISGTPLLNVEAHAKEINALFIENGLDPQKYYYVGECIVVPEYRGTKTGVPVHAQLTRMLQEYIQQTHYRSICFITAERGENHPQKPEGYRSIDALCVRNGCTKTSMQLTCEWDTVQADGSIKSEENTVVFWVREL